MADSFPLAESPRKASKKNPLPIFLGICQGALLRGAGYQLDVHRIGKFLAFPFFPNSLDNTFLLFAFRTSTFQMFNGLRITVRDAVKPTSSSSGGLNISESEVSELSVVGIAPLRPFRGLERNANARPNQSLVLFQDGGYTLFPIPTPSLLLTRPTDVEVVLSFQNTEQQVGGFTCRFAQPPPLTDEEKRALMSRPSCVGSITFTITCFKCSGQGVFQIRVDNNYDRTPGAGIPLDVAPEEWSCTCGNVTQPLEFLKAGAHELFRWSDRLGEKTELSCRPLYEPGAIDSLIALYRNALVQYRDDELALHAVIKDNPMLWDFLAPERIWSKPTLLGKRDTDFAVLDRSRVLYLIEIEKPSTKVAKKEKGGIHSELQLGLDQIREWRKTLEDHRLAVLSGFSLRTDQVHAIQYILIAGMASDTSSDGVELIRRNRNDVDRFYFFDDLITFLQATSLSLHRL